MGKSTLAEGIAAGLKKSGYKQILAVSVSAQAADNLGKKAHINSVTVAKLLGSRELHFKGDLQRGWGSDLLHHIRMIGRAAVGKKTWKPPRTKFNKRTALIIDEASMLSSEAFHSLTRAAHKKGTRIILLGDERQLSSPGGVGGPFRHLQNMPDIPKASLTRIVRQNDPQARANVLDLWRGKVNQVLDRLREKGDLQVIRGGREAARQALIATWKKTAVARPKDHLILASTREEVKALNLAAQQARLEAGKLGLVLARTPNYKLRMGDRVRITRNNRKLGLFNGTLGTIDGLTFRGAPILRLDDGRRCVLDRKTEKTLTLFYASTVHSAEGQSIPHVLVLAGGGMTSSETTLVEYSRGVQSTKVFIDQYEAGPNLEAYKRAASKEGAQDLAHSVLANQLPRSNRAARQHAHLRERSR